MHSKIKLLIIDTFSINNFVEFFLNLPTLIDFGGGKKVEMTYDAAGVMLTKKVYNTGAVLVENRTYNNGMEFVAYGTVNQVLELVHHSHEFYKSSCKSKLVFQFGNSDATSHVAIIGANARAFRYSVGTSGGVTIAKTLFGFSTNTKFLPSGANYVYRRYTGK